MQIDVLKQDQAFSNGSLGADLKIDLENSLNIRAKTSLRLKYEAESQIILKKFGGLRGIQAKLNLSQRKICQLLLVDPSSWSRWLSDEGKTPPHILRACEWYLALNDKYPGFDVNFWLHANGKQSGAVLETTQALQVSLLSESSNLRAQVLKLEEQIMNLKQALETHQKQEKSLEIKPSKLNLRSFLFGSLLSIGLFCCTYLVLRHFHFV